MNGSVKNIVLLRKQDQVMARLNDTAEEIPVKVLWARPISGRGEEISILGMDKKEVLMLDSLECLDPGSRKIAEEELDRRYLVPRIIVVKKTEANFGNRYWEVETDRGPRRFLMKDPNTNAIWITDDKLIIRDSLGNHYEIESLAALDDRSRAEVEKVI